MEKFEIFSSNLEVLKKAKYEDLDNEFIISGIIDKFFIQFELSWKVLKELLRYEGKSIANPGSPREIIKAAYAIYDYLDEEIWLEMLRVRNDMTHIYNGEAAKQMVSLILERYIPAFAVMEEKIRKDYGEILKDLYGGGNREIIKTGERLWKRRSSEVPSRHMRARRAFILSFRRNLNQSRLTMRSVRMRKE